MLSRLPWRASKFETWFGPKVEIQELYHPSSFEDASIHQEEYPPAGELSHEEAIAGGLGRNLGLASTAFLLYVALVQTRLKYFAYLQ